MLDVENIDDLGICSEFFARLPTRDVIFTEVGRYAPLLERPVIQAQQAYLLHHDVRFIVIPGDLMRNSHSGHTPSTLLGGFYQLIAATGPAGLFARTPLDGSAYRSDVRLFTENLAHPANAEAVQRDGHTLDPAEIRREYAFLFQESGAIAQDGVIEVVMAKHDTAVTGFYVDRVVARQPASLVWQLVSESGAVLLERRVQLLPDIPQRLMEALPYTVASTRFRLAVTGTSDAAPLAISDLRVLGQSRELQAFVRQHLSPNAVDQ
jgi:hypothetical protein